MEEFASLAVGALIGVCAEVVALGLQQVGREAFAAEGVKETERGRKGRGGDALLGGGGDDVAPATLALADLALEMRIKQQVREPLALVECLLDFSEELAADDAAAAPH